MIALFQSVDRDRFDLDTSSAEATDADAHLALTPHAALELLPALLQRGEIEGLNVLIRPCAARRAGDPALLRMEVDVTQLAEVEPYALLTLECAPDRYEAWVAMDTASWQSAKLLRQIAAATSSSGAPASFCPLAGSSGPDRVTLVEGVAGRVTTAMELGDSGALSHLWSSEIY